ncbi:MAG: TIGR02186 family protein [Rhizobiales bacterium]|nr:TIGR02186 family protein [Hyphomicrobiales bacterium]
MIRRLTAILAVVTAFAAASAPAAAEWLVTSLSKHRIQVTSNFGGEDLVLFGSVERDAATIPRRGGYDIVVTVTGPRKTFVTRRKERRLGIWINVDSREFDGTPTFLAVLTNRPVDQIASEDVRRRLKIGLDYQSLPQQNGANVADVVPEDAFRKAFIRINVQHQLYQESANAVTFLTPNLFRAAIPLPASVPVGTYAIDVKLLADGALIARTTSAFEVIKAGFEQIVADTAHQQPFLYGLITALMALLTGWLASVVFRRD